MNSLVDLRDSLANAVRTYGVEDMAKIDAAFQYIVKCYSAPDRFHHNLAHVMGVVGVIEELGGSTVVVLAGLYHDSVYDPHSKTNEELSGMLAQKELAILGVPQGACDLVEALVLSTGDYTKLPTDFEASILADADLSILGASPERYKEYVRGVRQEYAWVDDDAWRIGRGKLLQMFHDRPQLFTHATELEGPARANIGEELASL